MYYYVQRGNLNAIQILLARKRFTELNLTTALYVAAKAANIDVVKYLLNNGAGVDQAFLDNNLLHSFIPKLIFEMTNQHPEWIIEDHITCLKQLLTHLKANNPENLRLQLQIPISDKTTCYQWVSSEAENSGVNKLILIKQLLEEFGAQNLSHLSLDDLRSLGDIGSGYNMYDISCFKA